MRLPVMWAGGTHVQARECFGFLTVAVTNKGSDVTAANKTKDCLVAYDKSETPMTHVRKQGKNPKAAKAFPPIRPRPAPHRVAYRQPSRQS
jgi:hypothetical protein